MSKLSMGYLTYTVLVLLFVSARALHIEQSFDQSTFASVGGVTVQEVKRGPKAYTLERTTVGASQIAALKAAIQEDGFYTLRVSSDGASAETSIRAACLASPGSIEEFRITLDSDDRPVGLQYKLESGSCGKGAAAAVPAAWSPPSASVLRVSSPKQAPMVTPFGEDVASMLAGQQQQAAQQAAKAKQAGAGQAGAAAGAGAASGAAGGEGDKEAKPVDDRSWLAKNWLFVAAFGMAILNTMLKAQAGQGEQGRPAARR